MLYILPTMERTLMIMQVCGAVITFKHRNHITLNMTDKRQYLPYLETSDRDCHDDNETGKVGQCSKVKVQMFFVVCCV